MKIERMWIHFFSDIFAAVADPVICEYSRFSSLFAARDVSPGGTSAPQRQKFRTDDVNLSGIWWRALIGRRSSYIVLPIECFHMTSRRPYWCPKTMKRRPCWCPKRVLWELNSFLMQTRSFVPINLRRCWPREFKHSIVYEWQTKDKRPQRSNVNVVNLLQNSQYFTDIFFFRKSIAVEHKTSTKSIRRNIKSNKFTFGTQWLPDLLCKHWFTSSVWNFCRWGADVPPYICWMQFFRVNSDIQLLPTIPTPCHLSVIMFSLPQWFLGRYHISNYTTTWEISAVW